MKKLFNLVKNCVTIIANYSDFTKIAPTVPLCTGNQDLLLGIIYFSEEKNNRLCNNPEVTYVTYVT